MEDNEFNENSSTFIMIPFLYFHVALIFYLNPHTCTLYSTRSDLEIPHGHWDMAIKIKDQQQFKLSSFLIFIEYNTHLKIKTVTWQQAKAEMTWQDLIGYFWEMPQWLNEKFGPQSTCRHTTGGNYVGLHT